MAEAMELSLDLKQALTQFQQGEIDVAEEKIVFMHINATMVTRIISVIPLHDIVIAFRVSRNFLCKFAEVITTESDEISGGYAQQGRSINLFGDTAVPLIAANFPAPRFEEAGWRILQIPHSEIFNRIFNIHANSTETIADAIRYLHEREIITAGDIIEIQQRLADLISYYGEDLANQELQSGRGGIIKNLHGGDYEIGRKTLDAMRQLSKNLEAAPELGAHVHTVKVSRDNKDSLRLLP